MSSGPLPKAARGAVFVALLMALTTGISSQHGPIMLLGVCAVCLFAAAGIVLRRVWSAFGFALLLALAIVAKLFFGVTGQDSGTFIQTVISLLLYSAIAGLFVLAGLSLKVEGAKQGTPVPWILIALLLSVPFLFLRPVSVSSSSMAPAVLIGDFLLVDRFSGAPSIGELIAFHNPKDGQQVSIGRVVGLKANQYAVQGDAPKSPVETVNASDAIGKPKFIYDSMAPDPGPPTRRWERIFKTL